MGAWTPVSGAFAAGGRHAGPIAHCGPYQGPWPVQPPPELLDCSYLEFIVAVPGADPDDPNALTFTANPVYLSASRGYADETAETGMVVDFSCRTSSGDASDPTLFPARAPVGSHLYVRGQGAPVAGSPGTFDFPAADVATYVPKGYCAQGLNDHETAPGSIVTHDPTPGSISVAALLSTIGAWWGVADAFTSPNPEDVVHYLAQQASALTPAAVDGTHGYGLNYAFTHPAPSPPTNPDPGYVTGEMQYSELRADFPVPTLGAPGTPADFTSLVDTAAAAGHMPDGTTGYQWTADTPTGLGYDGEVTWTINGSSTTYNGDSPAGTLADAPIDPQTWIRTGGPTSGAFAAGSGTFLWNDRLHTAIQPGGLDNVIAVPAPPGVSAAAPLNEDYSIYCQVGGLLLLQDATNHYAVPFPETYVQHVQFTSQGAAMNYLLTYPAYRYYAPGAIVPSRPAVPATLRLTQRNDGRGIDRHPRLRASNNPPTSVQSHRAPRVGDTLYR